MKVSLFTTANYKNSPQTFKARFKSNDPVLQMYYDDIEKYKPLTAPEKKEINEQIKKGGEIADSAREKLVLSNLGRVAYLAQDYAGKGVSLGDLIQAGNLALIKEAENFKADNKRFWSNAIPRILNAFRTELMDNNSTVRIPIHAQEDLEEYGKITEHFELKHGRKPTIKELSKVSNVREIFIKKLFDAATKRTDIDFSQLKNKYIDAREKLDRKILKQDIKRLLQNLTETEKLIVEDTYGLKDGRPHDRFELARRYNTTIFRINIALSSAFIKMKSNLSPKLYEHIDKS